jgi:hypothetical protein
MIGPSDVSEAGWQSGRERREGIFVVKRERQARSTRV